MPTPAALNNTDELAEDEQINKANDYLGAQNVQPLAPPPMPPMLNFLDSDFSLNPTTTQSPSQRQSQGECNTTTGNAVVERTETEKNLIQYSDSDDADDCPVFEYSVESMEVATESEQQKEASQTAEAVAVSNSAQVENLLPAWMKFFQLLSDISHIHDSPSPYTCIVVLYTTIPTLHST